MSSVGPLSRHMDWINKLIAQLVEKSDYGFSLHRGDYVIMDLETTGFSRGKDVPWQFGAVLCVDGEPVKQFNKIVAITRDQFERCDPEVREMIHLTWDRIEQHGEPMLDVITQFDAFVNEYSYLPILGNNLIAFDWPFIEATCIRTPGAAVTVKRDRLFDLGTIIKGGQLHHSPGPYQTLMDYQNAVRQIRQRGVFWSISYVAAELGLDVDLSQAHDAVVDCCLVAMIMKRLLGIVPVEAANA